MMTGLFTTNCFDNKSDPYFVLHEQEERNWIYIHFQGYPYLIIGLPGLFLTSLLSIALSLSIFQKQNKLKKRRRFGNKFYILLLNRTIGDLIACLTSLMISIYTRVDQDETDTETDTEILGFFPISVSVFSFSVSKPIPIFSVHFSARNDTDSKTQNYQYCPSFRP